MFQRQNQQLVLDKITEVLDATDETHADRMTSLFDYAGRIFIAGAGRSKLVGNFLAMRLMHSGYDVYVVGEIVTPSVRQGDLLVVISGSGETEQLVAFAARAHSLGAKIALITAKSESALSSIAEDVFRIGSPDCYKKVKGMPMGTTFELTTLCFLEALISHIIWDKDFAEEDLKERHANLE